MPGDVVDAVVAEAEGLYAGGATRVDVEDAVDPGVAPAVTRPGFRWGWYGGGACFCCGCADEGDPKPNRSAVAAAGGAFFTGAAAAWRLAWSAFSLRC
jgi:hypothetical protein